MTHTLAAATCLDLMTSQVVTARPDDLLSDVRAQLEHHRISALPVVDGRGRLRGILTCQDLVHARPGDTPVAEVMRRRVHTVRQHMEACVAARIMLKSRIHHVVVIDPEQRVVGVLSSFDLLPLIPGCEHADASAERRALRAGSSAERRALR